MFAYRIDWFATFDIVHCQCWKIMECISWRAHIIQIFLMSDIQICQPFLPSYIYILSFLERHFHSFFNFIYFSYYLPRQHELNGSQFSPSTFPARGNGLNIQRLYTYFLMRLAIVYRLTQVSYCHILDARQVGANKVYTLSSIVS